MNGTFDPNVMFGGYALVRADGTGQENYDVFVKKEAETLVKSLGKQGALQKARTTAAGEGRGGEGPHWRNVAKYIQANVKDDAAKTDAATATGLIKFEARIYEKAEHWHFDTTVDAKDEQDAYRLFKKEYPKSEYTIQSVRKA